MRTVISQLSDAQTLPVKRFSLAQITLLMERLLETLDRSGLRADLAHHGFHAVQNHVVGYTLQELDLIRVVAESEAPMALATEYLDGLSPEVHPHTIAHVQQHLDGDTASSFELVLDLILDGLVRLNDPRARR